MNALARRPSAAAAPLVAGAGLFAAVSTLAVLRITADRPAAVPVLAAGAVVGVVLVRRPEWTLPAFVALTWTAVDASLLGGLPSPIKWGGLVLAGAGAVRAARHRELLAPPLRVVALLAVALLASWLAATNRTGLILADPLRDLSFLLIGAWCARGPADVDRVLTALVAVGIALGIGAISSVAIGPSALFPVVSEGGHQIRAAGPFGEPNFFALSLATVVPAALAQTGRGPARATFGLTAVAVVVGGILATGSRGALVAAGVAVLVMAVTGDRGSRRVGVVVVVGALALTPLFATQLGGAENRTVSGRATENLIAVAMAEDHPLLGVGPGAYPGLYRDYGRRIGSDPRSDRQPHSLPLQIAAEQGMVGLLCTLGAVLLTIAALRRAWWRAGPDGRRQRDPVARTLGLCLLTYAVGSLFLHGSQLRLPYLLMGMAFALAAAATSRALEPDREART